MPARPLAAIPLYEYNVYPAHWAASPQLGLLAFHGHRPEAVSPLPKGSLRVFNVARMCPLGRVAMYSISPGPPPDAYVQEFTARVVSAPRSALRSCSVKSRGMRCTAAFGPVFWGSSADSVGRGQDSADPTRHVGCRRWSVFSGRSWPCGVQSGRCLASSVDAVRGPSLPLPLVIGALCQSVPLGRATAPPRTLHWRASCVVVALFFPHGGASFGSSSPFLHWRVLHWRVYALTTLSLSLLFPFSPLPSSEVVGCWPTQQASRGPRSARQ